VEYIYQENKGTIEDIEKNYKKGIVIEPVAEYHLEQFEVES